MIKPIKEIEKYCLETLVANSDNNDEYDNIKLKLKAFEKKANSQSFCHELEKDYEDLKTTIEKKLNDLKKGLFCNQTVFFKELDDSVFNFGILIVLDNAYLTDPERAFLKQSILDKEEFEKIQKKVLDINYNLIDDLVKKIEEKSLKLMSIIKENIKLEEDLFIIRITKDETKLAIKAMRTFETQGLAFELIHEDLCLNLSELAYLAVIKCELKSIDSNVFKHSKFLRCINVANNFIKQIDESAFSHLAKILDKLYLSENNLSYLPKNVFFGLENLSNLNLSHNKIKTLNEDIFDSLVRLSYVDLSHNLLERVNLFRIFKNASELGYLNISNNFLQYICNEKELSQTDYDYVSLSKLVELNLSYNFIERVDAKVFRSMHILYKLNLSFNRIVEIEPGFLANQCFLETLYLNGNNLEGTLEANLFEGLTRVYELDLSKNKIENFSLGTFKELLRMKILNLCSNKLKRLDDKQKIFSENLSELLIDDNEVEFIKSDVFDDCDKMNFKSPTSLINQLRNREKLNKFQLMGRNESIRLINSDFFAEFKNLNSIEIFNTKLDNIEDYSFKTLPNLECLKLYGNHLAKIRAFTFYGLDNLKILNLSENRIREIEENSFESLKNLEELNISKNFIRYLNQKTLNGLESLSSLNLKKNLLFYLNNEADLFQKIRQLKTINLSFNRIKFIHKNLFLNLKCLKTIDLTNNRHLYKDTLNLNSDCKVEVLLDKFDEVEKRNYKKEIKFKDLIANCINNFNISELVIDGYNCLISFTSNMFQNTQINFLEIVDNKMIEKIESFSFSGICIFHIENNNIKHIETKIFGDSRVEGVCFRQNKIIRMDKNALLIDNLALNCYFQIENTNIESLDETIGNSYNLHTNAHFETVLFSSNMLSTLESSNFQNYFKYVTNLFLNNNNLTELNSAHFKGLTQLAQLDLSRNKIEYLEDENIFIDCKRLCNIDLSYNRLKSINECVFKANKIEILKLDYNQLDFIHKKVIENINYVSISNNNFNYLIINKKQERENTTKYVTLSSNKIKVIEKNTFFPKHINLLLDNNQLERIETLPSHYCITLDLSFNKLNETSIENDSFDNLTELNKLNLNNNHFKSLKFISKLRNLEKLNATNNQIESIDSALEYMEKLESVDLSNNNIKKINKNDLKFLKNLLKINLSDNQLETLNDDEEGGKSVFTENYLLNDLNLQRNKIKKIRKDTFSALKNLKTVDLSNNEIIFIEKGFLNNLYSLESISLKGNYNLADSILKENCLEIINNRYSQLKILDLSECGLTNLNENMFSSFAALEELYLSGNKLCKLEKNWFTGLFDTLTQIDLSNIEIEDEKQIEFLTNFVVLERLDLSKNKLNKLNLNIFSKLEYLIELNLSQNKIYQVINVDLSELNTSLHVDLKSLNISNNELTNWNEIESILNLLTNGNLHELDISNNSKLSFDCNYEQVNDILFENKKLKQLSYLNLSKNCLVNSNIEKFFSNKNTLINLEELDLTEIGLKELKSSYFEHFYSLDKLYFDGYFDSNNDENQSLNNFVKFEDFQLKFEKKYNLISHKTNWKHLYISKYLLK